jgi:hypothetical protein
LQKLRQFASRGGGGTGGEEEGVDGRAEGGEEVVEVRRRQGVGRDSTCGGRGRGEGMPAAGSRACGRSGRRDLDFGGGERRSKGRTEAGWR